MKGTSLVHALVIVGCGASTGLDVDRPNDGGVDATGPRLSDGIACDDLVCSAVDETCHLCGASWEHARCLPRGDDRWERCDTTPFELIVAECDGPEDCRGFDCEAYGAAIGSVHFQCGRSSDGDGVCHSDADCADGRRCGHGFGPYGHCR